MRFSIAQVVAMLPWPYGWQRCPRLAATAPAELCQRVWGLDVFFDVNASSNFLVLSRLPAFAAPGDGAEEKERDVRS